MSKNTYIYVFFIQSECIGFGHDAQIPKLTTLCKHTQAYIDAVVTNCGADHGLRPGLAKVTKNDGESECREGLGLRGDQCFVIWSRVYFFSAQVRLPSSPPHLPDRYSASTKVWEKAYKHVRQCTLTELKAMQFEISQAAVSILSPFLPLCRLCSAGCRVHAV